MAFEDRAIDVEPLIAGSALQRRIDELAEAIAKDMPPTMVVVGILTGSFVFVADLVRALDRHGLAPDVRFVQLASYFDGTESTGEVQVLGSLSGSFEGRAVLVVDDIQDTGRTLAMAKRILEDRGAKHVRTCALLDKPSRRVLEFQADYVGFTIPDVFVVGYGIDYAERFRHLPYIGQINGD
ncbi:MAG: hypoxanthine phosphoribosyltransferase [Geminicoccaceae bacterium]|nr:MAG: hypoxanthine phosphoribosyltransferase [Geminicoccaceae bacterium]